MLRATFWRLSNCPFCMPIWNGLPLAGRVTFVSGATIAETHEPSGDVGGNDVGRLAPVGYHAVDLLLDNDFDIVFLDWKMPGIKGGETIERAEKNIAANPESDRIWLNKRLPIITYSSSRSSDLEIPKARHFAFIDHWMKPMKYQDLHFQVREALNFVSNPAH